MNHLNEQQLKNLEKKVIAFELAGKKESKNKKVVIIGGQPASGKTLLLVKLSEILNPENTIVINGDELRRYDPAYHKLSIKHDASVADKTQKFANYLADSLKNEAMARGVNVIIEGTMRNYYVPLKTAQEFKERGYEASAHIMAVTGDRSMAGIYKRYEAQKSLVGYGRFSNPEIHDQAYHAIPQTADKLFKNKDVNHINIYNYKADVIYTNSLQSPNRVTSEWKNIIPPSIIINNERRRILGLDEKIEIIQNWSLVVELQRRRGVADEIPLKRLNTGLGELKQMPDFRELLETKQGLQR